MLYILRRWDDPEGFTTFHVCVHEHDETPEISSQSFPTEEKARAEYSHLDWQNTCGHGDPDILAFAELTVN